MAAQSTLNMTVDDTTFLVNKLHEDCAPGQFVREYTENSKRACAENSDGKGKIVWGAIELKAMGPKLMIADNGVGMTPKQMKDLLNRLSSSGGIQARGKNYGIGAKISALPINKQGLIYLSWQDGEGYMMHLHEDPETKKYGLKLLDDGNGGSGYVVRAAKGLKPNFIKKHGTAVIFLGNSAEENTLLAPKGVKPSTKWLTRAINTRYFEFPEGITVQAIEGKFNTDAEGRLEDEAQNREVVGQKAYLEQNSESYSEVPLTGATARWYILKDSKDSPLWNSKGHGGMLHQDEVYDVTSPGADSVAFLQECGVPVGYQRLVVYFEPDSKTPGITTDTARTRLSIDNEPLPKSLWASEFRANMPEEVAALIEAASDEAGLQDHRQRIERRIRDVFELSSEKPPHGQPVQKGEGREHSPGGGTSSGGGGGGGGEKKSSGKPSIVDLFIGSKGSADSKKTKEVGIPQVRWLSAADKSRSEGDELEGFAGRYVPGASEPLQLNGDFHIFQEEIDHACRKHKGRGIRKIAEQTVREWYAQSLLELVLTTRVSESTTKTWKHGAAAQLISQIGLTAAAMGSRWVMRSRITLSMAAKAGRGNTADHSEVKRSDVQGRKTTVEAKRAVA